jgi:hypothetical protein
MTAAVPTIEITTPNPKRTYTTIKIPCRERFQRRSVFFFLAAPSTFVAALQKLSTEMWLHFFLNSASNAFLESCALGPLRVVSGIFAFGSKY